jgi:heavy metal sensor kinase
MTDPLDAQLDPIDGGRAFFRSLTAPLHSLRFAIIAWQSIVLAATLAVFGAVIFDQQRRAALAEVDKKLAERAAALTRAVEPSALVGTPRVSEPERQRFLKEREWQYFVLWSDEHGVLDVSSETLDSTAVRNQGRPHPQGRAPALPPLRLFGDDGMVREKVFLGPPDTFVLIGRSIEKENAKSYQLAWQLIGGGGLVLLLGTAGGVALSYLMLRPIERMSEAAAGISPANLAQRIDESSAPIELRPLAAVLNHTFDRLEAAFGRQSRFTADAAHELRTPLAVILSQAEVALSKERSAGEYRRGLDACARAARRMNELTEKLLVLARCDSGELGIKRQAFDLAGLIRRVAGDYEAVARERNITIRLELHEVACRGDADLLGQAIGNLVANAVRCNHAGGEVRIDLHGEKDNDECVITGVITVADTGPGIALEDQRHVFDRFYRVERARSGKSGGAGLGLAIAKAIIQAHDGSIALKSEPGRGATFSVRLPCPWEGETNG